jgi:hypothetical protein
MRDETRREACGNPTDKEKAMTKLLAIATASALMASAAYAQVQTEPWWVEEGAQGAIVFNEENRASGGIPLLEEDNFAIPASCPEGSFYRSGENTVTACGPGGATFELAAPDAGTTMPGGDPWPENAQMMREPLGESGTQKSGESEQGKKNN